MIKNYMMMFVLIIPVQVFCSYPTEQEAEMLFSSNVLNKVDRINNSQFETFLMRMKRPATMETRKIVESKVLNGIMSINVSVSTNCIDESRSVIMISGDWVRRLSDCFQPVDFMTNHVVCISMAKYIGTLKQIDFPENLLRDTGPIVIMRSLNQYRRSDDEILRIKKEKNEAHRMALYEQNKEAYNLQRRVKTANYYVRRYRCELFSLCGKSIAGCRKIMNDEEFSNFTNQVVRLSNASEKEQKILFQKLNEDYEPRIKNSNDTKRRELELVKENFWISPEVVITNDWRFVLNEHILMRRYIDSIESPDLKKDLVERIIRRWREIDLGKISSSRYVIAADNYFKCIDFLLEDIQDAGVEVDSLTSNLNALLEKYRQMTMDDAELNSKAWGSEREKKFALRLLKKDYEENIRFFESKISPYYRKK